MRDDGVLCLPPKVFIILLYLPTFWFFGVPTLYLAIIGAVTAKEQHLRAHSWQALFLFLVWVVVMAICIVLFPILNIFSLAIMFAFTIATSVLFGIYCVMNCIWDGSEFRPRIFMIGKLCDKLAEKVCAK